MMQNINICFKFGLYWFNFLQQINHELNWCEILAKLWLPCCVLHKLITLLQIRIKKKVKTNNNKSPNWWNVPSNWCTDSEETQIVWTESRKVKIQPWAFLCLCLAPTKALCVGILWLHRDWSSGETFSKIEFKKFLFTITTEETSFRSEAYNSSAQGHNSPPKSNANCREPFFQSAHCCKSEVS